MKTIGQITTGVGVLTLGTLWSGYVLSILWRWFIVSQFPDMPSLSVAAAIGMALTIGYLTKQDDAASSKANDRRTTEEKIIEAVAVMVAKPLFVLAIGWVIHLFL